jgi:hypothetical protein
MTYRTFHLIPKWRCQQNGIWSTHPQTRRFRRCTRSKQIHKMVWACWMWGWLILCVPLTALIGPICLLSSLPAGCCTATPVCPKRCTTE